MQNKRFLQDIGLTSYEAAAYLSLFSFSFILLILSKDLFHRHSIVLKIILKRLIDFIHLRKER